MSFLKTSTKVGYFVKKLTEEKREDKIEVKRITLPFCEVVSKVFL
jgi:hypothetical protein